MWSLIINSLNKNKVTYVVGDFNAYEKRGEMKSLIQILLKKFPGMNFEWVKECNEQQIEKIQDHILMDMSYEEFYKLVLHDK